MKPCPLHDTPPADNSCLACYLIEREKLLPYDEHGKLRAPQHAKGGGVMRGDITEGDVPKPHGLCLTGGRTMEGAQVAEGVVVTPFKIDREQVVILKSREPLTTEQRVRVVEKLQGELPGNKIVLLDDGIDVVGIAEGYP